MTKAACYRGWSVSFARSLRFLPAALLLTSAPLLAGGLCRPVPAEDPEALPCEAGSLAARVEPRPTLRVVSYNVHYGRDVTGLAAAIAANAALAEADVLLFQEIESHPGDHRAEALARRLGLFFVYAPARPKKRGTHGLAILSRYPLSDFEVLALPHFDLGWGTHRRIALAATLDWNGTPVRVVNVHLDTRLTADQRARQMAPVLEHAAPYPRAVIGGDFNTISCLSALLPGVPIALPGTSQGPALDRHLQAHGYLTPFGRIGWTGPLRQRLDGVFVRGLDVGTFDKEDGVTASDHIPIWADVRLPSGGLGALLAAPLSLSARPTF
jgi:endonuclease/exonuclease/phosphatase family metal-dependent hydrolase